MERSTRSSSTKTGHADRGKPEGGRDRASSSHSDDDVLRLAGCERSSEHPLAAAIVAAANERKIALAQSWARFTAARVAIGMVEHRRVVLGNAKFLAELGIATDALSSERNGYAGDGATAIFVTIDGKLAGVVAIARPRQATTPAALDALRRDGLRIVMLTATTAPPHRRSEAPRHQRGRAEVLRITRATW